MNASDYLYLRRSVKNLAGAWRWPVAAAIFGLFWLVVDPVDHRQQGPGHAQPRPVHA